MFDLNGKIALVTGASYGIGYAIAKGLDRLGDYKPEHVIYVEKDGKNIATATAVENQAYPGEGWFRMIGTHADARGLGAGRLVCLAALHSLRDRGYKSAVLSTDDYRIPALKLYLSLGFEPVYSHESHKARWEKVFEAIKKHNQTDKSQYK